MAGKSKQEVSLSARGLMKKGGWLLLMLAATVIALMSTRFLLPDPPHVGPEIMANFIAHKPTFLAHVLGSLIALLIGPWQFIGGLRNRWPGLHRWTGRLYMLAVLVGGVGGFIVAWTTLAGPVAVAGFATLSVLWLYVTGKGYQTVRAGRYVEHRRWMIRSYALTAAAITLRLGLPIAPALGYDFMTGYIIQTWAAWLINLAVAEFYLYRELSRTASKGDEVSV
ncbi:DUF2306 domain-containing protein [Kiloniella laminariae]|uniref:DUF2306 domain-containing protein n=1 Tax=Kiloniella laminariae TaxID=454162 RepID=UPI001C3FB625|nr:DUF2306 domain-containing protein [Kiloniella laminariae]